MFSSCVTGIVGAELRYVFECEAKGPSYVLFQETPPGILDHRFDAERIESEGRKRLGDQDFEKAFAAGAVAGVDDLTRSS